MPGRPRSDPRRRRYLAGDALTLADLHAAPMFAYFYLAAEGAVLLERAPKIRGWWTRVRGAQVRHADLPADRLIALPQRARRSARSDGDQETHELRRAGSRELQDLLGHRNRVIASRRAPLTRIRVRCRGRREAVAHPRGNPFIDGGHVGTRLHRLDRHRPVCAAPDHSRHRGELAVDHILRNHRRSVYAGVVDSG